MTTASSLRALLSVDNARRSSFRFNRVVPQLFCALSSLALILPFLLGVLPNAAIGRWGLCVSGVIISIFIGWGSFRAVQRLQTKTRPVDCLPIYGAVALTMVVTVACDMAARPCADPP